ncbi:MAG: Clp protease N-terminal domain-containing protein, partial [Chitinispirillia bacterium]
MDLDNFTKKSQQALNTAHSIAVDYNHQEVLPVHIFFSLMKQDNGIIPALITKAGVSTNSIAEQILEKIKSIPSVSGSGAQQVYFAKDSSIVLNEAVAVSKKMKDDYVSVEHLFLALSTKNSTCKEILDKSGLSYHLIL